MKGLKKIIMVLMVLGMIAVFAAPASAKWFDVDVVYSTTLDTGDAAIRVARISDGVEKIFAIPTDAANKMLAMALSVQSSGGALYLQINVVSWSNLLPIDEMRVRSQAAQ